MAAHKLNLEIFDEEGNPTYTHHIIYEVKDGYSLRVTVNENTFLTGYVLFDKKEKSDPDMPEKRAVSPSLQLHARKLFCLQSLLQPD